MPARTPPTKRTRYANAEPSPIRPPKSVAPKVEGAPNVISTYPKKPMRGKKNG